MADYNFKDAEGKWKDYWEKEKIYAFDLKSKNKIFSVDTPPPTVSGKMHIGHTFSYTQQDIIMRYKRMRGFNVFYPFGTDDNGLPTERLIESMKNVKGSRMERNEFIKLCLETLNEIRPEIVEDWKRLGISADYNLFYSTINSHCRKISQKSFIDLYKAGREYQKEDATIWCPKCETAIAQVEMEDRELESTFNNIIFKLEDGKDMIIATTRPELLSSCVAVFVHPDDVRYKHLAGRKAIVPLFDYGVPILTDSRADPSKGTGAVMCCTFGDWTDVEWYKSHNLPLRISFTKDGRMSELAEKYAGLSIKEARKNIIEDLKLNKLLVNQNYIKHNVNVHERCGVEIEILNSKQWFIRYLDLKDKFLDAGRKLNWHPSHMFNRYENWVKGLQWDWCISRQRFFGIPIPVWYCKKCSKVIVADEKQLPVDPLINKPLKKCECGSSEFIPEGDVLDTWATSSLTPQIAASLLPELYDKIYPMDLRPQAHDIITFWLFNTVVKSQLHNNKNPWKDVMISGWALDPHGKKMSKSRGNVIEPQKVFDKFGADALRFWAASSKLGEDLPFQEKELVAGSRTVMKLLNAANFIFLNLKNYKGETVQNLELIDKWLLAKLDLLIGECTEAFENYEYSKVKSSVEKFFWHIFCDNYLEIVKDRLYNPDRRGKEARKSAEFVLYYAFLDLIKLLAPVMPFITEELYFRYYKNTLKKNSVHVLRWPEKRGIDLDVIEAGDKFADVISFVRKEKTKKGKSLKEEIKVLVCDEILRDAEEDLKAVTHAQAVEYSGKLRLEF